MSWIYTDYLEIKKDFVAVFTEEQNRNNPNSWQTFIAHSAFSKLLLDFMKALERGAAQDKRSLWVRGAYGTGKTFAMFALKHIMEEPTEAVEEFFRANAQIQAYWQRLKALREKGKYLILYRSSSSHITSTFKFLAELQQSIANELKAKGYDAYDGDTIHNAILDKLDNPHSLFDWNKAFLKYRGELMEFASAEKAIERLKIGDIALTHKVALILEKEGYIICDRPELVKSWLKEVVKRNHLDGIVYIWDEFTDFFINNAQLTGLQELAQLSGEIGFYLILVTHRALEQFQRIDIETRKKILDRFHNIHFEMQPVTAYQLMGRAIVAIKEVKEDWENKKENLWTKVEKITTYLLAEEGRKEDFKHLIPIHPISAWMLAKISSQFSSSQRTLFHFLKSDDEYSFIEFLRNYPKNGWYWYTADGLWDYFFLQGQSDFSDNIKDVIGYYLSHIELIEDETEKRIFKMIMFLIALWKKMPESDRFRATRNNLLMIFKGAPAEQRLMESLKSFSEKKLINAVPYGSTDEEYTIPLFTIDPLKLKSLQDQMRRAYPFETVAITSGDFGKELLKKFSTDDTILQRRFELRSVSPLDLRNKRQRVEPELKPYQIGLVIVVAMEEEHLQEAKRLSSEFAQKSEKSAYLVIETHFGKKRWEDWLDQKVHASYSREIKDNQNVLFHERRCSEILQSWLKEIDIGAQQLYFQQQTFHIVDKIGYIKQLWEINHAIFSCGAEKIITKGTLYNASGWGKAGAQVGLGIAKSETQQFKDIIKIFHAYDKENWENAKPEHPLSLMSAEVNQMFSSAEVVIIKKLWDKLIYPPYGLIPSHVASAIMGFLLKNYSYGYYWSDGVNCFPLNHDKLAELIEQVLKGLRGAESYEIRKMTHDDKDFCLLIQRVFSLATEKCAFPEEALKSLRTYITQLGFPLWAIQYNQEFIYKANTTSAIDLLENLISATDNSILQNPIELKKLVDMLHNTELVLQKYIKKEPLETGMRQFINEKCPSLLLSMEKLEISIDQAMERIRTLMSEERWLWKDEKVQARLPELHADYELTNAFNQLYGIKMQTLKDAVEYLNKTWLKTHGKLPFIVLVETDNSSAKPSLEQILFLSLGQTLDARMRLSLSEQLIETKEAVRNAVFHPESALMNWIQKYLTIETTLEEVAETLKNLPDLTLISDTQRLKQEIKSQLDAIAQKKFIFSLTQLWKEITNTESLSDLNERNKIPASWLLSGQDYSSFFNTLQKLSSKSKTDLDEAIRFLQANQTEFENLNNQKWVDEKYLDILASKYKNLILDSDNIELLKDAVYQNMGRLLANWEMREAQKFAEKWFNDFYQSSLYKRVYKAIDIMPEQQAKRYLKKLAENPLVGSILLSKDSKVN